MATATTSTHIVLVHQAKNHAKNMGYGAPALHVKSFDDGTALVRFAAGNILIVPVELLEPATEADAREYYKSASAA
jgi:hypothetical protein